MSEKEIKRTFQDTGARETLCNLQLSHQEDTEMASKTMERRNPKPAQRKLPPHGSANAFKGI